MPNPAPAADDLDTLVATLDDGVPTTGSVAARRADAAQHKAVGTTRLANRYEVVGLLGQGGMGSVYKALDVELQETVALKLLNPDLVKDDAALERFRQEVKLARRIAHANVVKTFDLGDDGRQRFLTMEFVDGMSLARYLQQRGRIDVLDFAQVAHQLCAGLQAAHAAGVLHRDLKPDNVLVARDGRVAITDFGIAVVNGALTGKGIVGTPAYMSPEQLQADTALDGRADVYALGAIFFELLTGRRAWPGSDAVSVAMARILQPPPDPRAFVPVPDPLAEVIQAALATDRNDRFDSAEALGTAVSEAIAPGLKVRAGKLTAGLKTGSAAAAQAAQSHSAAALSRDIKAALHAAVTVPPSASLRAQVPQAHAKTVTVLPFVVQGDGASWLGQALADEVADALSVTPGLKVRATSAAARQQLEDPQAAGSALGVQAVVGGTVRRLGDLWRLSVRVVGVADGFQLWAQRYDAQEGQLLVHTDAIARAVADCLMVELARADHKAPTDARAVEFYLRGRHALRQEWMSGGTSAVELLGAGLALAPRDPHLLAAFATASARQVFFGHVGEDVMQQARLAAEAATAAAPQLGEGWAAQAQIAMYSGDMPAAARNFAKALSCTPGLAWAQGQLGSICSEAGQFDRAEAHLQAAAQLEPFNAMVQWDLVRLEVLRGRFDRADEMLAHPSTDLTAEISRRFAQVRFRAWRRLPVTVDLPPADLIDNRLYHTVVLLSGMYSKAARGHALGAAELAQLAESVDASNARLRAARCQFAAEICALAGDSGRAMTYVREAVAADLHDLAWMQGCPALDALRALPEWAGLFATMAGRAERVLAAVAAA
ncbi:MAG: protein kinase [Deltaproteobacteria bacterium]|nr:protein kinase [Deltaproteobacteria bacterium]